MAWLARLDARAARWSTPARWIYGFCKWNLVAMGAVALVGTGIESLQRKEVGIGVAFLTYLVFNAVGLLIAGLKRLTSSPGPSSPR